MMDSSSDSSHSDSEPEDLGSDRELEIRPAVAAFAKADCGFRDGTPLSQKQIKQATALHRCVKHGYLKTLYKALKNGANVTCKQGNYDLLTFAVVQNRRQIVELLLKHGADVCKSDQYTPLSRAIRNNNLKVVDLLVNHVLTEEPDLKRKKYRSKRTFFEMEITNDKNPRNQRRTPLQFAIQHNRPDLLDIFIGMKADVNAKGSMNNTALHAAVKFGRRDMVLTLIRLGANVKAKNFKGDTILHEAAIAESDEEGIMKLILKSKPRVNCKGSKGFTPLHNAVCKGTEEMVKQLLECRADVHCKNADGWTPLHQAVDRSDTAILKLLLGHGADPNSVDNDQSTPLHLAVKFCNAEIVQLLIEHGAHVHAKDIAGKNPVLSSPSRLNLDVLEVFIKNGYDVNATDEKKSTVLMNSSRWLDAECVEYLLRNGANVNQTDENGESAIHKALIKNPSGVVELLIKHGASVNAENADGDGPLGVAISKRRKSAIELLLEKGADISARNRLQHMAIHTAALTGYHTAVEILVKHKASVNRRTLKNMTPLHIAALNNKLQCCKVLLDHGAEVNARDDDNNTPLLNCFQNYGEWRFGDDMILLLSNNGADVNAQNARKITPLHLAAQNSTVNICKHLLQRGAFVNARDDRANTPLHYLTKTMSLPSKSQVDKAHLLLDHGADVYIQNMEPVPMTPFYRLSEWYKQQEYCQDLAERMMRLIAAICESQDLPLPGELEEENSANLYYCARLDDCSFMKRIPVTNDGVSLLDVFIMKTEKLAKLVKKKKFEESCWRASSREEIDYYRKDFENRLKKAITWKNRINEVENLPFYLGGKVLPAVVVREIISYLSDTDMDSLMQVTC